MPSQIQSSCQVGGAVFNRNHQVHCSTILHKLNHHNSICESPPTIPEVLNARDAGNTPHMEVQVVILPAVDRAAHFIRADVLDFWGKRLNEYESNNKIFEEVYNYNWDMRW